MSAQSGKRTAIGCSPPLRVTSAWSHSCFHSCSPQQEDEDPQELIQALQGLMDDTASEENNSPPPPEEVHCSLLCCLVLEILGFHLQVIFVSIRKSK